MSVVNWIFKLVSTGKITKKPLLIWIDCSYVKMGTVIDSFSLLPINIIISKLILTTYFWWNFIANDEHRHIEISKYIFRLWQFFFQYTRNFNVGWEAFQLDTFLNFRAKILYSNPLYYVGITCYTLQFLLYLVTRKILWAVQIIQLLIIQTSPVFRYLVTHRVNQKKIMELIYIF